MNKVIQELYIEDPDYSEGATYTFAYFRRKWGSPTPKWTIYIKRDNEFIYQYDKPESPEGNIYFEYTYPDKNVTVRGIFNWSNMEVGEAINDVNINHAAFKIENSPYIYSFLSITPISKSIKDIEDVQNSGVVIEKLEIHNDRYIRNDKNPGDSLTLSETELSGNAYAMTSCTAGDIFRIIGQNSYAGRIWCFLDKDNKVLSIASGGMEIFNEDMTAPEKSVTALFNFSNIYTTVPTVYRKNKTVIDIINKENKPLMNKTILCLGDSNTEFVNSENKSYPDYLAEYSGANVVNGGIGGTKLRKRSSFNDTPSDITSAYAALDIVSISDAFARKDWTAQRNAANWLKNNESDDNISIIERLSSLNIENVDVLVLNGGTNDIDSIDNLGTEESYDAMKTAGALNTIIKNFLSINRKLQIYIATPIPRYFGESISSWDDEYWCDSYREGVLTQIVSMIKEVSIRNRIPVCDLYYEIGWNKYNFSEYYNDNDGTHAYKGYSKIANKIYNFILSH